MRQLLVLAFAFVAVFVLAMPSRATDIYDGTYSQVISPGGMPLNIYGGTFNGDLQANGASLINIFGGTFQSQVSANEGNINISGGEFFSYITANGSDARITVNGGTFHAQLGANGGSIFVGGGEFVSLYNTYAFIGASVGSITLYGSDFALNGAPIANGFFTQYGGGQLTGVLANGSQINVPLINNQGTFHFVPVPEPASVPLLVLCVLSLWMKRPRRTAHRQ